MVKNILVATDFSKRADPAFKRGVALAKLHGAHLTLVHVVDNDQSSRIAEAAQSEASSLLDALTVQHRNDNTIKVSFAVTCAEPHVGILETAQKIDADLIILGSHRRSLLRNSLVGTTAERTIRGSRFPVLVARSNDAAPYLRPAIALDIAESDESPLNGARSLALGDMNSLKVIFAFTIADYHYIRQSGLTENELRRYVNDHQHALLPRRKEACRKFGVEERQVMVVHAPFDVADAVLDAASKEKVDLLVLGTRRKKAFDRLRLGSVSEAVLRRSEIDILVVPPPEIIVEM